MKHRPALVHAALCMLLGVVLATVTTMNALAAALLASAALQINGALAVYEDARPGGFDNPDGKSAAGFTQGVGAAWLWARALGSAGICAALGLWLQFRPA